MIKKIVVLVAVVLGFSLIGPSDAEALTLIPPSFEFGVIPGQDSSTAIKVFNETAETLELFTEVTSFTNEGETGNPIFDFKAPLTGLAEWIEVEAGPIILAPGERKEIPVIINVPADADPGGHYAAVFFVDVPPEAGAGQVAIGAKLGSLILVRVAGEVEEGGNLAEFFAEDKKTTFSRLPISFFARFQNSGNVHLRPTGTITITNLFGKESAKVDLNEAKGATLPQTIRKYEAIWEKDQVQETTGNVWSNFWKEYSNEWNNFAFGRYKAQLNLTFGAANDQLATAETSFWVFPWRVIIISALILLVAIFLLIFLIKRYNAWLVKKAQLKK